MLKQDFSIILSNLHNILPRKALLHIEAHLIRLNMVQYLWEGLEHLVV